MEDFALQQKPKPKRNQPPGNFTSVAKTNAPRGTETQS